MSAVLPAPTGGDVAWRFGPCHLLPTRRQLFVEGRPVLLGGRAFDILEALVERAGQVVPRDELEARVWPRTVVEESSLRVQMGQLRRALGPAAELVVTVPGRGYSFVAGVRRVMGAAAATWVPQPPSTRLVGRDKALSGLLARVAAHRLVTVVGRGGVGKSALVGAAVQTLATRFPAGVTCVDAALPPDPGLAQQLRADRGRRRLIVVDGCEADVDAWAGAIASWVSAAASVSVLASSREPLCLTGEQRVRLDPLLLPEDGCTSGEARASHAVRLFIDCAQAGRSDARADPDARDVQTIAALCRRLEGVPLAIEVAASAVARHGLQGVHERLEDPGFLLDHANPTPVARHRTLRASLDWSLERLAPRERLVLRRIAACAGPVSLDQACALAARGDVDAADVAASLGLLVASSLLARDGDLYRLDDLMRAHVGGALAEPLQDFTGCA